MRLRRLTLENFRCYRQPTTIEFDDLTALVGCNDVGKSTVMDALAIFFEVASLDKEDGCKSGDRSAVRITCEFDRLPDKLVVDTDYETSLAAEYLLNDEGLLQVRKTYRGDLERPKIDKVDAIASHPSADGLADLLSLKRTDLIARAGELGVNLDGVNKQANAPIRAAIWAAAGDLQLQESVVPLEVAEGGKQVWSAISSYLPAFALFKSDRASTDQDSEAQDPLKAAIREAIKEVEPELQQVLERVENEVRKIADATVDKLREMDASLAETLRPVVTTKKWDTLFQTSITGDEDIPLNKRGSGVKRLVLLNFFRAKAERDAEGRSSTSVIYAVEEPETSQHPRNQRMLLTALRELASGDGRQVIITTHTPMLARYLDEDSLRFVEKAEDGSRSFAAGGGDTNALIAKSLGVLADHGVKLFIGVEGPHDISFLKGMASMLRSGGENVPDLEALELEGQIIFFPFGGSNLALWADRLAELNRPEIHVCDRDNEPPAAAKYADHIDQVNARPDCIAFATGKREMENYLHPLAIQQSYAQDQIAIQLPAIFADFADVPALVAEAVHNTTAGTPWAELTAAQQKKKAGHTKHRLNGAVPSLMTIDQLNQADPGGEIRQWLDAIQASIAGVGEWAG